MYLRTLRLRRKDGSKAEYIRLVESYREKGRIKQRVITTLGRKELLAPHLGRLAQLLGKERASDSPLPVPTEAAVWGPVLVARWLWKELGLEELLEEGGKRPGRRSRKVLSLSERAFVLVANRLCAPGSEHALSRWLDTDYVPDGQGERIRPVWKENGRVRVDHRFLWSWYRALDELIEKKERIESGLFHRLRDLFSLQPEMVFYDLTSSYFEGRGPEELARFGYSRDQREGNRQILLGVVMANGWPIAHHVFRGNLGDAETVQGVVADLQKRFGLRRVVFVGDRGMVSTANLGFLWTEGHGFLVGLRRRQSPEAIEYIQKAQAASWQPCSPESDDRVAEVAGKQPGERVFVVESAERKAYEETMRKNEVSQTREALEKLARRVEKGELPNAEAIGAAVQRILSRHHAARYFQWSLKGGKLRFSEEPLEKEKLLEGKYLILTQEKDLSPPDAVRAYKELGEVERAFRKMKDVLELRPIYHHDPKRVEAHVLVAALAFLLDRLLEKKLKGASLPFSSEEAWAHLRTIHAVAFQFGADRRRGVTAGNNQSRQILAALRIENREPWSIQKTAQLPV